MSIGKCAWVLIVPLFVLGACASKEKAETTEIDQHRVPAVIQRMRTLESEVASVAAEKDWSLKIAAGSRIERAWLDGSTLLLEAWNPRSRLYEIFSVDTARGRQNWMIELGPYRLLRQPHVGDGTIAFLTETDSGMVVVNARTGSRPWHIRTKIGPIPCSDAISAGATVFLGDHVSERLAAAAATDGRVGWDYRTAGRCTTAPLITTTLPRQMLIYATEAGELVALDAKEFNEVAPRSRDGWVKQFDAAVSADPVLTTFSVAGADADAPARSRTLVVAPCEDNFCYGVDAGSGRITWRLTSNMPFKSKAASANGRIYVKNTERMFVLNAATGERVWWPSGAEGLSDYAKTQFFGTPEGFETADRLLAANDDRVYLLWGDSTILRCNVDTGKIEGQQQLRSFDFYFTNEATGTLIVGTKDGYFLSYK